MKLGLDRSSLVPSLGAALIALASAVGCSGAPEAAPSRGDEGGGTDRDAPSSGAEPSGANGGAGPIGLVVIDVQRVFFDTASRRNPAVDPAALQTKTARLMNAASSHGVPVFVTYEDAKTGDHALPPSLASALPAQAKEIIKTTFDATGQPEFLGAVKSAGLTRVLVTGAETDVCVLQTMLGLRSAGIGVIAVRDAIFTEERNDAVARKRMRQAGVVDVDVDAAAAVLESGGQVATETPAADAKARRVKPLEIGIVLHDVEGLAGADPNASPKLVRLRELLLVSEWFRLPVFAADPAKATASLPANLRGVLTRPVLPLAERAGRVSQVVIAGGTAALEQAVDAVAADGDVFLVEDALVGRSSTDLDPLYPRAIPTTYKTLYYELTVSVDDRQWPSKQWVTDGARYFDMTMAPESLPPLGSP